jgi:hypothetical protein
LGALNRSTGLLAFAFGRPIAALTLASLLAAKLAASAESTTPGTEKPVDPKLLYALGVIWCDC